MADHVWHADIQAPPAIVVKCPGGWAIAELVGTIQSDRGDDGPAPVVVCYEPVGPPYETEAKAAVDAALILWRERLGATGRFPRGRADANDEGEIRLALAADHQQGIVRVVFGKLIASIGMPSHEAREFARLLTEKANQLDRRLT